MPCCLAILAAMFPRLVLFIMWLTGYGGRAFDTVLWPLLGFFLMPFTTAFYAIGINEHGEMRGWALALVILGVFFDLGTHGGSASRGRVQYVEYRKR